jgi:hypothetical protein
MTSLFFTLRYHLVYTPIVSQSSAIAINFWSDADEAMLLTSMNELAVPFDERWSGDVLKARCSFSDRILQLISVILVSMMVLFYSSSLFLGIHDVFLVSTMCSWYPRCVLGIHDVFGGEVRHV